MYIDNFVSIAVKRIKEKSDAMKEHLASGAARSFEDYRFIAGKITAHEEGIQILRDCFSQFFEKETIISHRNDDF
jgi:hypothetical protein